ncbi:MAG: hypothetical protein COA32_01790 [Fluviicola sp.]|nr:MAG: hypothetical protein COA32_01790 [Fluviicola sp.]
MKGKDEIKELFQKELGNYEAKVDPGLWSGVQSGLSGAVAGGTATGMSVANKLIISVVIATAAIVSSIVLFTNEDAKNTNQANVEKTNKKESITNDNSDDLIIEETQENTVDSKVEERNEVSETSTISKKENNNTEIEEIEIPEVIVSEVVVGEKEKPEPQEPVNTSNPNEKDNSKEEIKESHKPLSAEISVDKQDNQYVKFNVSGENFTRVEWYFGDGKSSSDIYPEHFYEEPGSFEVVAVLHGEGDEVIEKRININVEVKGKFTKLPNVISPNNDGSNDELFVEYEGIEEFQLTIYNQHQELIYKTDNVDFKWRGTDMKGNLVPVGKYVYVIMARDNAGNVINKYESLDVER